MKKVRFESPVKVFYKRMEEWDCHSPRPYIERQEPSRPNVTHSSRLLTYNPDPVQRFENSNSSPYPIVSKTSVPDSESKWEPSNDLDLSMLDYSSHEPRKPLISKQQLYSHNADTLCNHSNKLNDNNLCRNSTAHVLSSIENKVTRTTQNNCVDNNFFIRRENFDKFHADNLNALKNQLNKLSLSKENVTSIKTGETARSGSENVLCESRSKPLAMSSKHIPDECTCHHCSKTIQNATGNLSKHLSRTVHNYNSQTIPITPKHCVGMSQPNHICNCHNCVPINYTPKECECNRELNKSKENSRELQNAVDKKTWMLQTYNQSKEGCCREVDQQRNVMKEKREPTVADLFKIIKLQNEQLQLLQEKVDKFISVNSNKSINPPIQNFVTEQLAFESVDSEQHKISIGVMTSFEMVRTSTVINKEFVTQNSDNTQIHCNKSQISIKEVVSKTQPVNLNFLDGIMPVDKSASVQTDNCTGVDNHSSKSDTACGKVSYHENINDDKTLNELSLYNVQVDNATTPLISPEQSLYLDVRDYSDSDSGSDDQSNVGWTYYNKVMTHVNGMLQDSDMPSSASALYRNTRQQCVQMQIDKTNVSVTKRVKFGDDPLGIRQPHLYAASTDTSLKMNQLATKYLKGRPTLPPNIVAASKPAVPMEMSFATRNYMERHRILQGGPSVPVQYAPGEIPRFLDITALKQQPKLL